MSIESIQDILPLVEKPSRYLGTEINSVKKNHPAVALRFALAFPDLYEIGSSHFGLQILYSILNQEKEIAAERVFAPGLDMADFLRSRGLPLFSLESRLPLNQFDIIGFSLLYELNFTNIIGMLDLGGIPFLASARTSLHPVIIAGGPCTCNPEPVAELFDAIVVGDGEAVVLEMARSWLKWKQTRTGGNRKKLLEVWGQIPGVYIPSFFTPEYTPEGLQLLKSRPTGYDARVVRAVVPTMAAAPFPEAPILPYGKPVHDRLRLEVARGCTRGCRFCQAGIIYRPVRERAPEDLMKLSATALAATGHEDLSLLSLSTGDYGCLSALLQKMMVKCEAEKTAVSFPSLRIGTLTPELMTLVKRVRKTGFTLAVEAGSQRLRNVINKNITEDAIFETVAQAFKHGWQVIKLYFMIGLPTETEEDLAAIVGLVHKLRNIKILRGGRAKINVSVATFIPKAHTPFQWFGQISLEESKRKIFWLQNQLRLGGVHFKWQDPEVSLLEGLWARGDRKLTRLLLDAYGKGCQFDAWSDHFRFDRWREAIQDTGIDLGFYIHRDRDPDEALPWDHIQTRVSKEFLKREWQKALSGELTPDCRSGSCSQCGACDFNTIFPRVFKECRLNSGDPPAVVSSDETETFEVTYSKTDDARFFGHLEMAAIFTRAIRRARIPVKYSQGFHPLPKVSFQDPLPVGMESEAETFHISVAPGIAPGALKRALNAQLPSGLAIQNCKAIPHAKRMGKPSARVEYQVVLKDGVFEAAHLEEFKRAKNFVFSRQTRKGAVEEIDLKNIVDDLRLRDPATLVMVLNNQSQKVVRPLEVIKQISHLSGELLLQARVTKKRSVAARKASKRTHTQKN
jgi:radical SAM family uncharacterized protein/radical SAM-linked protein